MSKIGVVLPNSSDELRQLIIDFAQQNVNLIVMEEIWWVNYNFYNEMHIIGSDEDMDLCYQIRSRLSKEERASLTYDKNDRQLICSVSEYDEKSKVFHNISPELAEQLVSK